jgi:IS1 family transposase
MAEGVSLRAITRLTGINRTTLLKLLVDAGKSFSDYQDRTLVNLRCERVQVDEAWAFCYAKQRNVATAKAAPEGAGDIWTWVGLDADTKLVASYYVGGRDGDAAMTFINDLARRLSTRVQLTSDGLRSYLEAKPDPKHISTSYSERQNLNIRMGNRRMTRLTNAFSKKAENHAHMMSIYFMHYNFVRIHQTLMVTPAMAAGVSKRLWEMSDLVDVLEAWEATI